MPASSSQGGQTLLSDIPIRGGPCERPYTDVLPAALYSARLIRPGSTLAQTCQAQVTDSATTTCMPHQTELDATGFFKETGWWK